MTKEMLYMMLELHNVMIEPSNMRKKKKKTTKCEKIIITCDVGTTQCKDKTIKYEKKVREPPNLTKNYHM